MTQKRLIYITVLIPILIIVLSAFFQLWYLQRVFPRQDFIYSASRWSCADKIRHSIFPQFRPSSYNTADNCDNFELYVYHFKSQTSTPIRLASVEQMDLPSHMQSDEGYIIKSDTLYSDFGFSLLPDVQHSFTVIKGQHHRTIHLQPPVHNDQNYFQFIAWMPESTDDNR